jgi:hypothetical protein
MSSLRSLAFILASAIRRARALSCAALHRFPDKNSGKKMAANMATKMAVVCIVVPYGQFIPSSDGTSRRFQSKYDQGRFKTAPALQ